MEHLYVVTIDGYAMYMKGNLSEHEEQLVENISMRIRTRNYGRSSPEANFKLLIQQAKEEFRIVLEPLSVKYVFRI